MCDMQLSYIAQSCADLNFKLTVLNNPILFSILSKLIKVETIYYTYADNHKFHYSYNRANGIKTNIIVKLVHY